jgi:hypothetical protein
VDVEQLQPLHGHAGEYSGNDDAAHLHVGVGHEDIESDEHRRHQDVGQQDYQETHHRSEQQQIWQLAGHGSYED